MNVVEKHKALSRALYVNGAYAAGVGEAIPVINPATEEMIGVITEATEREIEAALGFAAAAQRKWWALSGAERADIMHEVTRATRAMSAALAEFSRASRARLIRRRRTRSAGARAQPATTPRSAGRRAGACTGRRHPVSST